MWGIFLAGLVCEIVRASYEPFQSFGLLTVTHSRNGDFSVLEKYLKRYTETACYSSLISEINIIWNNEDAPESTPLLKSMDSWKIPVYFFRTTFNSMDHRYRLPKESTAQLLYSLDDDIIVDCQTFENTLKRFNQVSNQQQLGRVTTNQVRAHGFDPNKGMEYFYQGHASAIYYTIAEPGAAFVPRHYLELYYLKLDELKYMHDIVLDVKNCDDIFFWAIIQHFYPEMGGIYIKGVKNYKNTDPKVGQSKTKNVYNVRSRCISNISQALGYNSLRHFHKNATAYLDNWQFPNLDLILTQKIAGLTGVQQTPAEQKEAPVVRVKKNVPPVVEKTKKVVEKVIKVEEQVQWIKDTDMKKADDIKQAETVEVKKDPSETKISFPSNSEIQPIRTPSKRDTPLPLSTPPPPQPIIKNDEEKVLQVSSLGLQGVSFELKVSLLVLTVVVLVYALFKMYQRHQQTSQLYSERLDDYQEQQNIYPSSIRLPDHY